MQTRLENEEVTTCLDGLGALQGKQIQKIRDYYGSGWVGPCLTRNFVVVGKSSQNSPKPVLIFWSSIPCAFCLYTLFKVVSYYDLSVFSMSMMGFQKKSLNWVCGWDRLYPIFLGIFFNFAKLLTVPQRNYVQ